MEHSAESGQGTCKLATIRLSIQKATPMLGKTLGQHVNASRRPSPESCWQTLVGLGKLVS